MLVSVAVNAKALPHYRAGSGILGKYDAMDCMGKLSVPARLGTKAKAKLMPGRCTFT